LIKLKTILQYEQQILASALLVYHSLTWSITDSKLHLAFTLILYGLFLLWQPLWNKDIRINKVSVTAVTAFSLTVTFFFPKEALIFFGLLISGLIGSRLLTQSSFRSFDLLALLIVILEMAVGVVPSAFPQIKLPGLFGDYMQAIILVPILLFFFLPARGHKKQERSQVDLMHGLLAATLIFIVLLGGIVISLLYGVDYIDGLLLTVFIVSTLTLGISWFWNPGVGYSGIGVLWNRYAMTIGGPFEVWINTLTSLIEERYLTPVEYLEAACERLVENEWLNGIQWNFESFNVFAGEKLGPNFKHSPGKNISVDLYYKSNPGSALEQHTILLIRMAYQFYLAKLNQEKVRAQEHFATIHHTGARLTHDVKNILQSIKTSLDILEDETDSKVQQELLQSNLTQIGSRLENTLNKLKTPLLDTKFLLTDCQEWMDKLESQHRSNSRLIFNRDIEATVLIPGDLFDSVVENLISNASRKTSALQIDIRLLASKEIILLSVCDNGEAITQSIEADLFSQPLSSGSGMGIGLYQSSIMASAYSFELELSQNEKGRVCFSLFQHLGE